MQEELCSLSAADSQSVGSLKMAAGLQEVFFKMMIVGMFTKEAYVSVI